MLSDEERFDMANELIRRLAAGESPDVVHAVQGRYRGNRRRFRKDPKAMLAGAGSVAGFGGAEVVVVLSPFLFALVDKVADFVVGAVGRSAVERLRARFGRRKASAARAGVPPTVAEVHEFAVTQMTRWGRPDAAEAAALMLVEYLIARGELAGQAR